MYHTGQRKGLGIGGLKDSSEDPWYVVDKDVANNVLVVAQGHDHPRLMSVGLIAQQLHWVDRLPLSGPFRCTVKTRYRQQDIPCTVTPLDDERIEVRFDEPVSAVTPASRRCSTVAKSASAAASSNSARRNCPAKKNAAFTAAFFIQNSTCAPARSPGSAGFRTGPAPVARCAATAGTPCRECANTVAVCPAPAYRAT